MIDVLSSPFGDVQLKIYPPTRDKSLRAWDAADEYLLDYLQQYNLTAMNSRLYIVNDRYGALTVALADFSPVSITDSFISQQAAQRNLILNRRDIKKVTWLNSLQIPSKTAKIALFKIPHNLALLEDQLIRLKHFIHSDTLILAAGMSKYIRTSTLELFSRILGPTTTSLARKKARLVFCQYDPTLAVTDSPYPMTFELENPPLRLFNHANVFSLKKLDIGSRFMLQHLPQDTKVQRVLDLGCGNGLLGIAYSMINPSCSITFADESYMAIASAKAGFSHTFGTIRHASFHIGDCLDDYDGEPFELILNNPPFHQQNIITDDIAWKMFRQSHSNLSSGGTLRVVANRHLGYHSKLKKLFGKVRIVASNQKFVILDAIRTL